MRRASGYRAELYDDVACLGSCDLGTGTKVPVVTGAVVSGIDFALDRLGGISGTLTDAGSGDPIVGERVEIYDCVRNLRKHPPTPTATGSYLADRSGRGNLLCPDQYRRSYIDELYDDLPCESGCIATSGNAVSGLPRHDDHGHRLRAWRRTARSPAR